MTEKEKTEKTEEIMEKFKKLSDKEKTYVTGLMEGMTIKSQMEKEKVS